jgi:hypothetical protein
VIEPSTVYLENWHIDLIAEHLEAVTAGQIKRLLFSMLQNRRISIMWATGFGRAVRFPGTHNPALERPGTKRVSPGRQIRYNAETRPHGHFLRTLLSSSEPQRHVPPFPRDHEAFSRVFPSRRPCR